MENQISKRMENEMETTTMGSIGVILGDCLGDSIGDYYSGIKGDARSLDYGSDGVFPDKKAPASI